MENLKEQKEQNDKEKCFKEQNNKDQDGKEQKEQNLSLKPNEKEHTVENARKINNLIDD
ncbi:hypothetical protein NBO_66g0011 [Nosema bombycis CQ1]|uniref:Uncharacterized protein n=1 Tax=Nosema bombycis (strain CQ1 / CVCC 102059) TaxID=578461 RepID=R0KTJ5_NOSB1|nr:hypothetical protein NBO_66g0011 [Nosema bombycis CQ1]|eukprot:EOB13552.1 hypothetical protein NBO_66g0011 [Nosema bombycis CQ1]